MRVSLPGRDALSDTDPDHYSLYSDEDNVLIKEKSRGTIAVSAFSVGTLAHNLGYVPLFMSYYDNNGTTKAWTYGLGVYNGFEVYADEDNIYFYNKDVSAGTFQYYLFYDRQI